MKNYHIFKDFCEPLDECLSIHKLVENTKQILAHYNIPQFQWTVDSIKKEKKNSRTYPSTKNFRKDQNRF